MPHPQYLMAGALLVLLTLAPLSGWPFGEVSAHAQMTHEAGGSATIGAPGIYALVQR